MEPDEPDDADHGEIPPGMIDLFIALEEGASEDDLRALDEAGWPAPED